MESEMSEMNIGDVELIYSSVISMSNEFKSINHKISSLQNKLDQVSSFENEVTEVVNSIYHSIEVNDYSAADKSKIIKLLEKSLRERRAAKMCREYIEALKGQFDEFDIKYKPLIDSCIDKAINKVAHKHKGIASKSKDSVKLVNRMIRGES